MMARPGIDDKFRSGAACGSAPGEERTMAIDIISKAFDERTGQTVDARAAEAVEGMLRALPQEVLDRLPDEWNLTVKFRRSEPPAPKGRGIDDGTAGPSERDIERGKSLIRPSGGRVVRFAVLPHAEPLAIECPGGGTDGLRVALLALEYLNADRTGNMKDPATGMALDALHFPESYREFGR